MPTNLYTEVTFGDQTFSIKRFDAKTGLKLARLVIAKAAPLIPLIDSATKGNNADDNRIYSAVGGILETLSDKDIDDLIDKCMRVCFLNLPAGAQPVVDETGHYGVENVEYDMPLTLKLCFEAIKWGASDFFGENGFDLNKIRGLVG